MFDWLKKWLTRSAFDNPSQGIDKVFRDLQSNYGKSYSAERVLGLPAVFRATKLISGKLGGLPWQVFRQTADGREEDSNHQAARFFANCNPYFGLRTLISCLVSHALLRGNGYGLLIGFPATRVEILDPSVTRPVVSNGEIVYETKINKQTRTFGAESILHVKNLSHDGYCGLSVVDLLRQSLGIAIVHEDWEKSIYDNGATPLTVIEMPGSFHDEDEANLWRKGWKEKMTGTANAGETAILTLGAHLNRLPLNMEDAQFLQSKEFDLRTVALATGCPPHKLASNINVSYSSLESEERAFLSDCLEDWIQAILEEFNLKLRTEDEKRNDKITIDCNRKALVRTDAATEQTILNSQLLNMQLTPNMIAKMQNRPLLPADIGDQYLMPANTVFAEQAAEPDPVPPPLPEPVPQPDQQRFKELLAVDVGRLFKRIAKSGGDVEHRAILIEALSPVPDIEVKVDCFLAELRQDRSILDRPADFVEKLC